MTSPPQVAAQGSLDSLGGRRRSWTGWQFVGPFMAVFALVFLALCLAGVTWIFRTGYRLKS